MSIKKAGIFCESAKNCRGKISGEPLKDSQQDSRRQRGIWRMEQNSFQDLYREIVTNLLEGVMVISMNGRITMLNPAAEHMLGLTQEDIGDSFINKFLTREGTDDFNEVILDTIYEKEKVSDMPVNYVLEGKIRNLSLTTSYIQSDGEKSVVVVIDDVTELNELRDARTALDRIRKLNKEYEKAKNEAVMANEAKSLFLSNMSHEIRTPINAVLGMNEMILRECRDQQLLSYAANIRSSGKTLLFLINDILDLSKIESGKMEIIEVEYEPAVLIMDLWNMIFLRAREKDLSIHFSLDETLPRVLYGDDVRIKQVVTNLLTNAVKYTPGGGIELYMAYERKGPEQICLIISVKDTGMGIKQEDMGKLFESFQRLDEEQNRHIEGTGLGMNITMSLLKLMDGEMKVESEYGKGSVFTVTIPQKIICDEPTGDFESIRSRQEQGRSEYRQAFEAPEARVLVVDDNAMNLTVFTSLLKRTRIQIDTAGSGRACLELVKKQKYHIIFMDHMMPEMDGIETFHEIRKLEDFPNQDTPVIVLTANAVSGAREGYMKEGFADFLTKPIDGDVLEQTVAEYLPQELIRKREIFEGEKEAGSACVSCGSENFLPGSSGRARTDLTGVSGRKEALDGGKGEEHFLQYGISLNSGLSHALNDVETFLDLAVLFLKEREKQETMAEFLAKDDMKNYAVLVHGLKGNARTLGADQLADMAFEHEKKSKAGDAPWVKSHWNELLALWEHTLEGFRELCGSKAQKDASGEQEDTAGLTETENVRAKGIADAEDSRKVLRLTQADLEQTALLLDDFETEQAIERLKEWLESPLEREMQALVKKVLTALEDEFDEDKAISLLREKGGN